MKLFIKNMVCDRCKTAVQSELEALGLEPISVALGEVEIKKSLSETAKLKLNTRLEALGFELIDDKKQRLTERVKNLIVELVHHKKENPNVNISAYLTQQIPLEYNYMSHLFSESEGTTIEKFYIAQKLERVKELLAYGELSLNEIADQMGYSSAAYLSAQFKKMTGITPSQFRNSGISRKSISDL